MPGEPKKRMSVWVDEETRQAMRDIAKEVGLSSESAAIRYAVRKVSREMKRQRPSSSAGGEEATDA